MLRQHSVFFDWQTDLKMITTIFWKLSCEVLIEGKAQQTYLEALQPGVIARKK